MAQSYLTSSTRVVVGDPEHNRKWEAAIVIQGPYISPDITERVVRIFLEHNDQSVLIIVSSLNRPKTPVQDPLSLLSEYELKAIGSKRLVYIFSDVPSDDDKDFHRTNLRNQNCQILSSFIGIQYANSLGIPFCLKCRSDAFLAKDNICQYLRDKFVLSILPSSITIRPRGRIVVSDHTRKENYHLERPEAGRYQVADIWLFGYTDDLLDYFDVRDGSTWDNGRGISTDHAVETNLAELWMRNIGVDEQQVGGLAELAKRNLAIADSVDVEFIWMQQNNFHLYTLWLNHGIRIVLETNLYDMDRRMSHARWLELIGHLPEEKNIITE